MSFVLKTNRIVSYCGLFIFVAPTAVVHAADQRCELVTQPQATACLNLTKLDTATIQVPANTTRIPSDGLVLCGTPPVQAGPVDIVYVVDQTASMKPTEITVNGKDTVGWYECNRFVDTPKITTTGSISSFHGLKVNIIDSKFSYADVKSVCAMAGDPFSVRGVAVQEAIKTQAKEAPASYAATINFAGDIISTQKSMTELANATAMATLLKSVPLGDESGTHYEEPLAWARILLEGGHTDSNVTPRVIAASKNKQKAIILISDGKPHKDWIKGLKDTATATVSGVLWKTDDRTSPPVYGIYLGIDTSAGTLLDSLARLTGGRYFMIPPNKPDSLAKVVQNILGQLIAATKPEGAKVVNNTNGQASEAKSSVVNGNSYKMLLDSLVGLVPGVNNLTISTTQGGAPVKLNLKVLVSDAPKTAASPLDLILTTRCYDLSKITVKPDVSGLSWADSLDRKLMVTLSNVPDQYSTLPIKVVTVVTKDAENIPLAVPSGSSGYTVNTFKQSIAWRMLAAAGAVPGDDTVRSYYGWDTAVFRFAMPRDSRDTAVARIALHFPLPPPKGPDSVVYFDADGDGALDLAKLYLKAPAIAGAEVQLPWPDASTFLDVSKAKSSLSKDSLVVTYVFSPQSPDATTPKAALVAAWRSKSTYPWENVPVVEHIAPVAMEARLSRGDVLDTLRVSTSETIKPTLSLLTNLVGRSVSGVGQNLSPASSLVDSRDGSLLLLFPAATSGSQVVPGDSVRFLGAVQDLSGNAPGAMAKKVIVKGVDPSPRDAILHDVDGDGRADLVVVRLRFPLTVTDSMGFSWPGAGTGLDGRRFPVSAAVVDSNGLRLTFTVAPFAPDMTACPVSGCANLAWMSSARFGSDARSAFPLRDGVASVPTEATLLRGEVFDTLRISASEAIKPILSATTDLVGRSVGGVIRNLSSASALQDPVDGALLLLIPAATSGSQVVPGDSVRFLGSVLDHSGNAPGATAKMVVVKGVDPLPRDAVLEDGDGDGRADKVLVRLRFPLTVTDSMGFLWPNPGGGLDARRLPVSAAVVDSNGLRMTFAVAPFEFASTSCPATGCQNLAWMSSGRFGGNIASSFQLRDGVDPVPLLAKYRFSALADARDTLIVKFSEPLLAAGVDRWVSVGRPSQTKIGNALVNHVAPLWTGSTEIAFLVDSTDRIGTSDSLRITAGGALTDSAYNNPDSIALWTSIEWGLPPPALSIHVVQPVVKEPSTTVPPQEPAVTLVVRHPNGGWMPTQGSLPDGIDTRFGGPLVRLNRIPKRLGLYIYDNLGVSVLSKDITGLSDLEASGILKRSRRGDYEVWLAWDTMNDQGKPVASGVYFFRVWGIFEEEGKTRVINQIVNEGVHRK